MYYSESMIQMVEDLHRQASDMEKEVKDMMELEGRALGIELDKRKNVRELYNELMDHSHAQAEAQAMTWAYVPCDMAEHDPNCYPVEEFVESAPVMDEACVHVEEHVVESEAPVDVEAPVDAEPHAFVESPESAPVEEHHEEVVEEAPVHEEAPIDPNQPEG